MKYDVAVVGLGGMGSAIAAQAAARGASVFGVEQYRPVHDLGSSHGRSRMIRKSYFEDAAYVPLLRRAYELWMELEKAADEKLYRETGVLTVGEEQSEIVQGTKRAAQEHDLPLVTMRHDEAQSRYPAARFLPQEVALLELEAGLLDPEGAVRAHLKMARARGAELRFETSLTRWDATSDGFEIFLSDGARVTARTLVLALGPWFKKTLETLGVAIRIQRNVQVWFSQGTKAYHAENFPAFLVDRPESAGAALRLS